MSVNPSPPPLFERDSFMALLEADRRTAAGGEGRIVLVCGEAGIGKSSLLEKFRREHPETRCLWGACEALFTPHPLGPLHDIAYDISRDTRQASRLKTLLESGTERALVFAEVVNVLAEAPVPTVLVIEDAHWADEATLDLIKFLGRRITRMPALLVLSYRDDEVDAGHPLRRVLGELPARQITRLSLPRLSQHAVELMACTTARSGEAVFQATDGNPFFVTEVLASRESGVPATVRDAVLARAARLSPAAREVVELAGIVPGAIELALIDAVLSPPLAVIEECVNSGLLIAEEHDLHFRHELARVAVEASLAPPRAATMHARVLAVLSNAGAGIAAPLARLAHHAHHAGDIPAVLRLAPLAANEAYARGARREAAAHCRAALKYSEHLNDMDHAVLLEDLACHCFELNDFESAIPAGAAAVEMFGKVGNPARQSAALAAHAISLVRALRNDEADQAGRRAIELAESLPPSREWGRACQAQSSLRMLDRDYRKAIEWGEKAVELARQFDDPDTLVAACNSIGGALLFIDYPRGREKILEGLKLSADIPGGGYGVAHAYMMLGSGAGELFLFDDAEHYLAEGIAYARSQDLDRLGGYMDAWQAVLDVYLGRWDAASTRANALLLRENFGSTTRVTALIAIARLRLRRGDPGADEVLAEALALASRSNTLQRLAPVKNLLAEQAWLAGDTGRVSEQARDIFELAQRKTHPWFLGEAAYWLWRIGDIDVAPAGCAPPYALQIAGDWRAAAAAWKRIGCPFEQARALVDGDIDAQREAVAIFEKLGAKPMAEWLRNQLRAEGVRGIPRGPRAATRDNPAGLTAREMEVLVLVAEGCQNSQIAERLSRSPRTVDHHLASILAKLSVDSRAGAVSCARRLGILPASPK